MIQNVVNLLSVLIAFSMCEIVFQHLDVHHEVRDEDSFQDDVQV